MNKAKEYGELAGVIVTEHGQTLPQYPTLLSRIYQWQAVVYGEIALEVIESDERQHLQAGARDFLKRAKMLDKNNYLIRFQLALQKAEIGEVSHN